MRHFTSLDQAVPVLEALASPVRRQILVHLQQNNTANLQQLAKALQLSNGALTTHIKKLQDAGLITVKAVPGERGSQKMCSLAETQLIIDFFADTQAAKQVYSFDIGIGQYVAQHIRPTCGIVTRKAIIGEMDDPRYFTFPERINAALLWFAEGEITYLLPNSLKLAERCTELQISLELASEAPGFTTNYPSDIGFAINGHPLGHFTSPGEYNDRRGIFTPDWWFESLGQYGRLKLLSINNEGSFIDGRQISQTNLEDLNIVPGTEILFSLGVNENATYKGGVSLFGKGFGDYNIGISVKMFYEIKR